MFSSTLHFYPVLVQFYSFTNFRDVVVDKMFSTSTEEEK